MTKVTKRTASSFHGHRMRASRSKSVGSKSTPTPTPTPSPTPSPSPSPSPTPNPKIKRRIVAGSSFSGSASTVFILLVTLLILISWKQVGSGLIKLAWDPNAQGILVGGLDWKPIIGAFVFIAIAVMIANSSPEAGGFMVIFALGIITVYMIENNGGAFTSLFNFLSPSSSNPAPIVSVGNDGTFKVLSSNSSGNNTIIPLSSVVQQNTMQHA